MQPKFCAKCGNAINEGEKFCRRCGNPIGQIKGSAANETPIGSGREADVPENPEGTVILGGIGQLGQREKSVKRGTLVLSFEEMLRGCTKVIDFGTGKRYKIIVPTGLSPGDVIKVADTGIVDTGSGDECEIELIASIG